MYRTARKDKKDNVDAEEELPDKIRVKFETLSKRLQKINVDIIHQSPENYNLQEISPFHKELDEYDCFLAQELIRLRTLDTSVAFKQLHHALYPLAQSLPEVIHHQSKIVKILVENLNTFPAKYISSVFNLMSVFTRDLKEDIKPHFDLMFSSLVKRIRMVAMAGGATEEEQAPNPELTAVLFETLSYLIKANLKFLSEEPDELSPYYGAVLGSSTTFVREFGAKTFSIVLRKASTKVLKNHFKKILKATSQNVANVLDYDFSQISLEQSTETVNTDEDEISEGKSISAVLLSFHSKHANKKISGSLRRCNYLLDGLSKLFFYSIKGIRGFLHSKGLPRINAIFQLSFQSFQVMKKKDTTESTTFTDLIIQEKFLLQIQGLVNYHMTQLLLYHLYPENQLSVLPEIFQLIQSTLSEMNATYFVNRNNVEEQFILLLIQFFYLLLDGNDKFWKREKLFRPASKTTKCAAAPVIESLIENAFELFRILHSSQYTHYFQSSTIQASREIIVKVWNLFPAEMVFQQYESIKSLLLDMLVAPENIEKGLLYFAANLYPKLSTSRSRDTVLLPLLLQAVDSLRVKVSSEQWLSATLQLFYIFHDHRINTDAILRLDHYEATEKLSSPQFTLIISEVKAILLKQLPHFTTKKDLFMTTASEGQNCFRLSMLVLNWATLNLSPDLFKGLFDSSFTVPFLNFMKQNLWKHMESLLLLPSYALPVSALEFFVHLLSNTAVGLSKEKTFLIQIIRKLITFVIQQVSSLSLLYIINLLLDTLRDLERQENGAKEEEEEIIYIMESILMADEREKLLLALSEGLTSGSYYRKYYLIQILSHFEPPLDKTAKPTKAIVTSSSYKREMDDSDEEDYSRTQLQVMDNEVRILDVARICQEIVSFPIDLRHEREIKRRLEMLEVYCRGGTTKLPKEYLAIIAGFSLGLLHVKFKPLWSACINVLVTITQSERGEEILWPLYWIILERTSRPNEIESSVIGKGNAVLSTMQYLEQFDLFDDTFPVEVKTSPLFPIAIGTMTSELSVQPDATTDRETIYLQLLEFLKNVPMLLLKRSKVLVEHFITFLNNIFYQSYEKDPEVGSLQRIGLLVTSEHSRFAADEMKLKESSSRFTTWLTRKEMAKRLEAFLHAFAVIPSPKQLYKHGLLFAFYHELLTKADTVIAKLALQCIFTYKPVYAMPYKESLLNLYNEKLFRDELVNIDSDNTVSSRSTSTTTGEEKDYRIKPEHREGFYHLTLRILYGRLLSRPTGGSKRNINDQIASRRSAIIAFMIRTYVPGMRHFLYFMIRGIAVSIDSEAIITTTAGGKEIFTSDLLKVEEFLMTGFSRVQRIYATIEKDFQLIPWERLQGFLHLLEPIFKIFGMAVNDFVPLLYGLIIKVLHYSQVQRETLMVRAAEEKKQLREEQESDDDVSDAEKVDEEGAKEEEVNVAEKNTSNKFDIIHAANLSVNVRTLCLQRLADLYESYATILPIADPAQELFPLITPLIQAFPTAVAQARRKPALLSVLEQVASHVETLPIITSQSLVVQKLIECIAYPIVEIPILKSLFTTLQQIFESPFSLAMIPFSELLVSNFSKRFHQAVVNVKDQSTAMIVEESTEEIPLLKVSDIVCKKLGGLNVELRLLCTVAEKIFSQQTITISNRSATNLATIMLGMLRSYLNSRKLRLQEQWLLNVFTVYQSLIWRMEDVSGHLTFLSRVFGPTPYASSLFNKISLRMELLRTYEVLGHHPSVASAVLPSIDTMKALMNYENTTMISSERNSESFIPAIRSLSSDPTKWDELLGPISLSRHLTATAPPTEKKSKKSNKEVTRKTISISPKQIEYHVLLCSAVVFETIRTLYEEEFATRNAGTQALKALVTQLLQWHQEMTTSKTSESLIQFDAPYQGEWLSLLKSVVMPALRKGIQSSSDLIKTNFLSIFTHVIRSCAKIELVDEALHTDLIVLLHEDPEQDFFENISHIQLHRRTRAFLRLKNQMLVNPSEAGELVLPDKVITIGEKISTGSYLHVLLPLGFYYLSSNDFTKKIHRQFLQEIAGLIGAMVQYLPFHHYLNIFKKLIKLLQKANEEKQSIIQIALTSILDHFQFDLSAPVKEGHSAVQQNDEENKESREVDEEEENDDDENNKENEEQDQPVDQTKTADDSVSSSKRIADIVIYYIFPVVKSFLLKETTDQDNKKTKMVQTNIAIALTNLLKQLQPPLITAAQRIDIFSNLVLGIVDTFKSKDVNVRDAARNCLTRMVNILGFMAFERILFEMHSILTEGYQRHVLLYSIRSILVQVTENYTPPIDAKVLTLEELSEIQQEINNQKALQTKHQQQDTLEALVERLQITVPDFDRCIPDLMKGVLLDLSDSIREEREETDGIIRKSTIREVKGSKFNEILEVIAKNLLFRPTYALLTPANPTMLSSIHAVATPLLEFLSSTNADSAIDDFTEATRTGRVAEGLQRVAQGLSRNPSVDHRELLLYIHASLQPFVGLMLKQYRRYKQSTGRIVDQATDVGNNAKKNRSKEKNRKRREKEGIESVDSDLELVLPSYLRGESSDEEETFECMRQDKSYKDEVTGYKAASWVPSDWNSITEQRLVIEERNRAQRELIRVQDGASAPKMTGRNRYDKTKRSASANNGIEKPTLLAIKFCLTLLSTCLKKGLFKSPAKQTAKRISIAADSQPMEVEGDHHPEESSEEELQGMLLPFIPILRSFLHLPNAAEIVILSIKCLTQLIRNQVPFEGVLLNKITNRILMIMVQYNVSKITAENELCQVCIQLLLTIFRRYNQQHAFSRPMNLVDEQVIKAHNNGDHRVACEEHRAMERSRRERASREIDFPLPEFRMKILLDSLLDGISESNHVFQVIIFQLIREIIKTHILLPEIYPLIQKILEQIVQSHYKNIRLISAKIIIEFLLSYPITKVKHEEYLQQLLGLCQYPYETGRLSAYETIYYVINHFPLPVVEDYAVMLFLQLTLQLSHESSLSAPSKVCQEEIIKCLMLLFQKVAGNAVIVPEIEGYLLLWLGTLFKYLPTVEITDVSGLRNWKSQITFEMKELVIVGCKLTTIFFKSMTMSPSNDGSSSYKSQPKKLTKHQKEMMRQCYTLIYENFILVCLFHMIIMEDQLAQNDEAYVVARLQAIDHPAVQQLGKDGGQTKSSAMIPWDEHYWYLLYQLLVVFETSYEWNAEFIDGFITSIDISSLSIASTSIFSFVVNSSSSPNSAVTLSLLLHEKTGQLKVCMEIVSELLLYNHSWIRNVSLRILAHYLHYRLALPALDDSVIDTTSQLSLASVRSSFSHPKGQYLQRLLQQREKRLSTESTSKQNDLEKELLLQSNSFYFLGRKLCLLLNQSTMKIDYLMVLNQSVLLLLRGMWQYPELDTVAVVESALKATPKSKKESSLMSTKSATSFFNISEVLSKKRYSSDSESEKDSDRDNDEEDGEEEEESTTSSGESEEVEEDEVEIAFDQGNNNEETEVIAAHVSNNSKHNQDKFDKEDDDMEEETVSENDDENMNKISDQKRNNNEKNDVDNDDEDEEITNDKNFFEDDIMREGQQATAKRGISWMMNRLRAIGADRRSTKRIRILQLYMDLVQQQSEEFLLQFIGQIMEIPIRVVLSYNRVQQQLQLQQTKFRQSQQQLLTIDGDITKIPLDQLTPEENHQWQYLLATNLLRQLEEKLSPEDYLTYYTKISTFLQQKKLQKKVETKAEAVSNPQAYAAKRIMKSKTKMLSRKRKISNYLANKGKRRKVLR